MKTRIEDEFIHSLIEDWLKKGSNIIFWEIFQNRAAPGRNYLFSSFIFLSQPVDNHWAEIGLKSVEGNSIEHLVRFAYYFVIFSKEWINPDRVEAVLAALGLKLNKEKTYVGTVEKGFEFVGFYFQEIADDNGLRNSIKGYTY